MNILQHFAIRQKLVLIIMSTTLVTLLLAIFTMMMIDVSRLKKSLINEISGITEIIAFNSRAALLFDDRNTAEIILSSMQYAPSVISACILDKNGNTFCIYNRDATKTKDYFSEFRTEGYHLKKNRLYLSQKILSENELIGFICIESDLKYIENTVFQYGLIALAVLLIAGIIALLISNLFQRVISVPIIKLAEFTKSISRSRDYSSRMEKQSEDEIGQLVEAYNEMLSQIQIRKVERDRAEEALRSSEARYRNLFEESPISLWEEDYSRVEKYIKDLKLSGITDFAAYFEQNPDAVRRCAEMVRIIDINKMTLRMLNYETKEELSTNLAALFRQESYDLFKKELIALANGETIFETETINLTADNQKIDVIFRLSLVQGYDDWSKVIVSISDISRQKQTERELQRERDFEKTLINNAKVIISVIDNDDKFIMVNPYMEETSGYQAGELLGKTWIDFLFPKENQEEARKVFANIIKDSTTSPNTFPIVTKNGEIRAIDWYDSALRDDKGNFTGYLMIGQDISDRLRAEETLKQAHNELEIKVNERTQELTQANLQLQELDQLKSMFIASMSHELRTPLNSIIGFTGILLMGMTGPISDEQKRQLSMVKNSANHLLALINDVIDVSKIESGKIDLAIMEFDLTATIMEIKDSFKTVIEDKGIGLAVDISRSVVIRSDQRRVKQILMNLIGNAIKFTDKGQIIIRVLVKDKNIDIMVKDSGIGIKKEDLDKLFKAFSRIYTEGVLREGTGLGLHLSQRLALLLGGTITAASEYGKGSEFTFSLPLNYQEVRI